MNQKVASLDLFAAFSVLFKSSCQFIEVLEIIRHESEYTGSYILSVKCFMRLLLLLLSFLPTLSLHALSSHNTEQQLGTSRHIWSSLVSRFSVLSPGRAQPTCRYAALDSSLTSWTPVKQTSLKPLLFPPLPALAPPPPSSSSSRLSGNEVGLRDDALHFVIRRVRRRLVATDRHFVSVSLEITRREKGLQRRCATEVTIQLYY